MSHDLAAAEGRLVSCDDPRTASFLQQVADELARARRKFPSSEGSMCALTEEVGELAKAAMDEPTGRVRAEAVQVATMAARVALEGDPTLGMIRLRRQAGPHPHPADT
jgi:hypothetical protein